MARKKYPKGFKAIPFTVTLTLSTLAVDTVIKTDIFTNAFTEGFWCNSIKGTFAMRDATVGEQPIEAGFAHSDYTVGEIAEKLVADESNIRGNKIAVEQSQRKVRVCGSFPQLTVAGADVRMTQADVRYGLGFKIENGFNIVIWARNRSGANPITTGAVVQMTGTLFGRFTA